MKVVYFGSDVFLSCFEYFVEKHQVLALYTYHNDEDYFTEYAIVRRAGELGIPVHYEAISPEEIRRYFTEEGCELFFIAEYDRILTLPEELPAFRGINTHSSLLPDVLQVAVDLLIIGVLLAGPVVLLHAVSVDEIRRHGGLTERERGVLLLHPRPVQLGNRGGQDRREDGGHRHQSQQQLGL